MKLHAAIMCVQAHGMYYPVIKYMSEDKSKVEDYEKEYGEKNLFSRKLSIVEINTDEGIGVGSTVYW